MKYAFFSKKNKRDIMIMCVSNIFGIMLGVLLYRILKPSQKNYVNIYWEYIRIKLKEEKIIGWDFFWYVFRYRIKELLFFVLMGLNEYRLFFFSGYLCLLGTRLGVIICVMTTIAKWKMPLLVLAYYFPQIIAYIFLIKYMIFDVKNDKKIRVKFTKISVMLMLMVFLESVVNPFFVYLFKM